MASMNALKKTDRRPRMSTPDPRANQRDRTRIAIMDATRRLLVAGRIPSIDDAAEEARVSRATAYRYFPTQGALIQDAVTAVMPQDEEWTDHLRDDGDLPKRA